MYRVFIGVGHGGKDPGAVGRVREADANLVVALAMADELRRNGVDVIMSRTKDENDPLTEEIREANAARCMLAVDIHSNAGGGDGWEAFVQTNEYVTFSRAVAEAIETRVEEIGQNSRGIKTRKNSAGKDYYGFLRNVKCPSVIVEGFFVDSNDADDFISVEKQRGLGFAYAHGVLDYLCIRWQETNVDSTFPTFVEAVDLLCREKIIDSPSYWKNRTDYSMDNVRLLVRKMGDYIRFGGVTE